MSEGEADNEGRTEPDQKTYTEVIANSVLGWSLFVDTALESNIYREARDAMGSENAARIALFRLYLECFTEPERTTLLENSDYFLQYAFGVVRELYPPHPKTRHTIHHNRVVFMTSVRQFLVSERRLSTDRYREACKILRAISLMSRSVEEIVRARDLYREFQFRIAAQRNLDWVQPWNALPLETPEGQ
jgi:hypothetical protein